MVAHAIALVALTDVTAQEDTMTLAVSTGMPAYPPPAKMVVHAVALVAHTDVAAQEHTLVKIVNTKLEIFVSMHEVELISKIEIHGSITVTPTLKLQHMIIWDTVLRNVPMTMVVI